jgi:hypothetical protein
MATPALAPTNVFLECVRQEIKLSVMMMMVTNVRRLIVIRRSGA